MGLLNLVVDASLFILLSNIRQSCYLGYFAKKFAPIEMFFYLSLDDERIIEEKKNNNNRLRRKKWETI